MNAQRKLGLYRFLQRFFPIWALRRQANVVYHLFDSDLANAKDNRQKFEETEHQRFWEVSEFEDRIRAITSLKLMVEARKLYIYLPDMEWESGHWGDRYLTRISLSKLYHAVKEQKDKNKEYSLKLAGTSASIIGALTGIIGALIGLLAVWKKLK